MKTRYFDTNLVLGTPGKGCKGVVHMEEIVKACDDNNVEYGLVSHLGGLVHDPDVGNGLLKKEWEKDFDKNRFFPVPIFNINNISEKYNLNYWKKLGSKLVAIGPAFYKHESGIKIEYFAELLRDSRLHLMMPMTSAYGNTPVLSLSSNVVDFAGSFPDIKVIVTNISRKDYGWIVKSMNTHGNIYVDIGNLSTGNGIEKLVSFGFEDRMICGSGFGISYINVNKDNVNYSDLTDDIKSKILHKNAEELFR